jgi:protein SCO1/2
VAAVLAAVPAVAGCSEGRAEPPVANVSVDHPGGLHGALLPKPYRVQDVTLTDTEGGRYSLTGDSTKPLTLVFFGYTHCPDICQLVMADIASAMTRLDGPDRARVGMLFVTSDPARDNPAVLRRYLDRFDPRFEGLTGPMSTIKRAADALGVPIEKGTKLPSGGYDVAHGTQIVGMRSDGTAPVVWTEGTSPAQLAGDLTKLLHENG